MNRIFLTPIVKQIVIGCVVLFIGSILMGNKGINLNEYLAMHYPHNPLFKPWQLISHMFMHGGFSHLLFNMIGLISIGVVVENFMGSKRFLTLFFFAGFGAIGIHILSQIIELHNITGLWFPSANDLDLVIEGEKVKTNSPLIPDSETLSKVSSIIFSQVVGASGALYGVVTAFAFLFPNTELMIMFIPYPIKAKYLVPGFILIDIVMGFSSFGWDPIAHFAHIGGALFGLLLVMYWRKFDKKNFW
jgi:membrane associated rhomboid family serine protease